MPDQSSRDIIWKHVSSIKTCMMVMHDAGAVRARPMRGIARPEENAIWFFADMESHADLKSSNACLTFANMKDNTFVSLSGTLNWIQDQDAAMGLWSDGAEGYFPTGPDDPRLVLLRFNPVEGEYWDSPSNPIVLAIKFVEAKITGERPDLGSNGRAKL